MESKEEKGLIFIRLFPGEDLFEALREICRKHNVETAVVVSGLGMLKDFELGYFRKKGDYAQQEFGKAQELCALSGIASRHEGSYNFHFHAVLADENKQVVGGHLIKGKVAVTNEIVLMKSDVRVKRKLEDESGLMGLVLE